MIDVIGSGLSAIDWTAALVLYCLFRLRGNGSWNLLQRYFGWKIIAWSLLIVMQTTYFIISELRGAYWSWFPWFETAEQQGLRWLPFLLVQGIASWGLILHMLRPQLVPVVAAVTAQVTMNRDGIITGWNEPAMLLLGWTADEVIGRELATVLIPEDLMITHPVTGAKISARDAHREGLSRFRATGESSMLNAKFPVVILRKEGSPLTVYLHVSSHGGGHFTSFLGIITPRAPWEA